jgi:hypothetical protein
MSKNEFEQESLFEAPPLLSKADLKRSKFSAPISPVTLQKVWSFYCSTFYEGRRGLKPKLTDARVKLITGAVNEFGVDVVLDAIRGCSLSDWHMGRNPQGRVYNSIELILRDSRKVEMFVGFTVADDTKGGFLDD